MGSSVSVVLRLDCDAETLGSRLAEREGSAWDFFSSAERGAAEAALAAKQRAFAGSVAGVSGTLSSVGRLRVVDASGPEEATVSSALALLAGVSLTNWVPLPVAAVSIGVSKPF